MWIFSISIYIYIYILKLKFSLEMFWTKVTCGALRGRFRFLKLLFLSAAFSLMILGNIFLTLFDVYGETWMRGWREQRKINAQGQTNIHLDTGAKIWAFFSFTVKKKKNNLFGVSRHIDLVFTSWSSVWLMLLTRL